jgi:hypothetical protein
MFNFLFFLVWNFAQMWTIEKNITWYFISHSSHVCFEKKGQNFEKKNQNFFLPHFNLDFYLGSKKKF